MDPQRFAEVDAVLEAALGLEPSARPGFLDIRCAGDPELRREVEDLLERSAYEMETYLRPVREFADRELHNGDVLPAGTEIGAYRVVRTLGRGGMGVVALAERRDGVFEQRVAIKVLPLAMGSAEAVRRFEMERQILARLSHPGIAHLVDGGIDARGLPYLVMEHIEGSPIDRYCDERRLEVEARLRLVVEIARAVHAAHRSLVIHRDIKPSNLLVGAGGIPKLLDFGIAKLIDPAAGESAITATAARLLTPTYASPEQVRGEPITTSSDVYQLGLLLYELVSGRRPQEATTVSLAELVRAVCEHDPPPLSKAVLEAATQGATAERLAADRGTTPARLARRCRGDLDAIVSRALAKEPERRYLSAEDLASDLERHLAGRPVRARRATWRYRARKFLRRHAAASMVAGLAIVLTLTYAVAVTLQARALDRQRERAELEARKATEVEQFLIRLFADSDPNRSLTPDVTARELMARGLGRLETELGDQPEVQARLLSMIGLAQNELGLLDEGIALQRRALEARRRLFPPGHAEVAESLFRLGLQLREKGDLQAAGPPLEEATAILRREKPGSVELSSALTELGSLRRSEGRYEVAQSLYEESMALRRQRADRVAVATGLNNLGTVALARGDDPQAASYFREALAIYRLDYPEGHPQTQTTVGNLGQALSGMGDHATALPLLEEVLTIRRSTHPADSPEVADALLSVGDNLMKQNRLDEAEPYFAQADAIFRVKLTPDHPLVITYHGRLADLRRRQGRFAEAKAEYDIALTARRARFGPDHPQVAQILMSLGSWHFAQGQTAEAEAVWNQGLAMVDGGRNPRIERKIRELMAQLEVRGAG